jgi:NAD(P)-dependent dehydrogenase (short-subunit alcohol dehydrogenase family)
MTMFAGRIALVTGASRGIGAAIAEKLAAEGAHVILTARTAKDLEAVDDRIFAAGGSATIAPLDLTETGSIDRLAAALRERWGKIDYLVLNAAMLGTLSPVPVIDAAEFNRVLTLNVLAQHAMIASFDDLLRASDSGRLIVMTSSVGAKPRAYWGAYGASKAALENLALSYAEEVQNLSRVKVAIVDPGKTRTKMRALAYPGEDPATLKEPAIVGEAIAKLLSDDFETGNRLVIS